MYVYLSKILPILVMPLVLVLLMCILAAVFVFRGNYKQGRLLLLGATTTLWLASMPWVAASLYQSLESRFPPEPINSIPVSSCIVLLGGALGLPSAPRQDFEMNEAIDRVYKAAELYRAGKAGRVFVTGGNQPWHEPGPSEASLIGELLVEWGVPADAIHLEGLSRNTRENALNIKPMLDAAQCDRSLLVTSAGHMQRALASFKAVGLFAYPVSTDVRVTESSGFIVMDFIPDAQALAMTSDAIREYMGLVVYKLKGWN